MPPMPVGGDADGEQSSSSISSPPMSPQNVDTIRVSHTPNLNSGGGVVANAPSATSANAANGNKSTSTSTTAPDKPKRQRKKKEPALGPDGKPIVEEKPKKVRKPREPKEKTANGTSTAAPRKKVKTEPKNEDKNSHDAPAPSRQPTITEMVGAFPQPTQLSLAPPIANPISARPISSGQNYDPIRGSTMEARPSIPPQPTQPVSPHRASASPSIASLIDPPTMIKPPPPPITYPPQTSPEKPFTPSQNSPPPPPQPASVPFPPPPPAPPQPAAQQTSIANNTMDGAMDIDPKHDSRPSQIPEIKAPSKSSSGAPTPKAAAARPTPEPPKGTGSGLLSSSDLFGGASSSEPSERRGVDITLHIPLNPAGGNTINIAQEIIKKYGRDAINPRAAAHREQLLRIAEQQERLGGASNDEMSVDLLSEVDGDSNVEMGGMDDEKSNTGLDADGKPARKRRKKVEEYDKEDDFIDDTELAWQEQAAVAKDGFFVYSGPLVPEGTQPQVESSAPSRSRGRGRGRGARSSAASTTHASLAEKTRDAPAPASSTAATTATSTRARGTRGRGSGAPRKPRITKAEKERMENEKAERERSALGSSPIAAPAKPAPTAAPTTALPSTPLAQPPLQHSNHAPPPPPQPQPQPRPLDSMA